MSKLYAELMNSIEAVRSKHQDTHREMEALRDMTYQDNIYVEFGGYGIQVKARVSLIDALIKELEFKISELGKVEASLLATLEAVQDIDL